MKYNFLQKLFSGTPLYAGVEIQKPRTIFLWNFPALSINNDDDDGDADVVDDADDNDDNDHHDHDQQKTQDNISVEFPSLE